MNREDIRPFAYGWRFHDCVRFNGGATFNGARPIDSFPVYDQATIDRLLAVTRETTGFADKRGRELFLGDVVRAAIEEPFNETHGNWADYEITKAAGGYVLSYVRSEKGCQLPFGYTGTFINQFGVDELPDLKMLLFHGKPVRHPKLLAVECDLTPIERRELFMVEARARREAAR